MPIAITITIANLIIFAALKAAWLIMPDGAKAIEQLIGALALPSSAAELAMKPWTIVSYMFIHLDFWHLLVNSLWLASFGSLFDEITDNRTTLCCYIGGGVVGATVYVATSTSADNCLVGASAATCALIVATLIAEPGRRVHLPIVGSMALRSFAIACALIFVLAIIEMEPGQTAAHLGGIVWGVLLASAYRIYGMLRVRNTRQKARLRLQHIELIDKARCNGYNSLTPTERTRLFNIAERNNSIAPLRTSSGLNTRK